jgi:hypothetical protein
MWEGTCALHAEGNAGCCRYGMYTRGVTLRRAGLQSRILLDTASVDMVIYQRIRRRGVVA